MKYGVKSITMDEIAKAAGISKKTIYQNFNDKNDLVYTITVNELNQDQQFFDSLLHECTNAIDEVFRIAQHIRNHISQMNPSLLFDLKKFHVRAWDYYNQHKAECFEKSVNNNLNRGIKEGYYRKNINPKILSRMRMAQVEAAFNGEWFSPSEFNIIDVQMQVFEHFIMGVVTPEGLKLYNQYLQNGSE